MRPLRRIVSTAFLLYVAVGAGVASATKIEGVQFARQVRVADATLDLYNAALLRYRIFIKAYVGALYLGRGVNVDNVLDDVPKRLEIEYFWGIEAKDFAKATVRGIADNVEPAALADLQPRIDRINRLYRDVKPGDRYSLTYLPDVGTELALNGRTLGRIEGSDFASAVFAIWLGPRPLDEAFRDDLLTRR